MTDSAPTQTPDQVTVLVFKDNYASRTFQIPLKWFGRFGMLLGALAGLSFVSLFFALKYYQVAKTADPDKLRDLEEALVDMKARALAPPPVPGAAPDAAPAPKSTSAAGSPLLFHALPSLVTPAPANPKAVPISIHAPQVKWNGKNLTVHFELQYVLLDKGSQQGRIILLARGPSTFLSYPAGVINAGGKDTLIDPEKGEYFSVSRMRAVDASFGPMPAGNEINQLEVLILSSSFQILIHDFLPVEGAKSPVQPKTAPEPAGAAADAAKPEAKPGPKIETRKESRRESRKAKARAAEPAVTEDENDAPASDPEASSPESVPTAPDSAPAAPPADASGTSTLPTETGATP
jgi:hypothetical protein